MMDACIRAVVEAIHSSPTQPVLYLSDGASMALGYVMSLPGASNTVLEAVVPYSRTSMIQQLGKVPSQFCSQQIAEEMASLAYNRALKLSRPGSSVLGVDFTGSLATTRPKLGDNRFHLSTRTSDRLWVSTGFANSRRRKDSSHLLTKIHDEPEDVAIANACKLRGKFVTGLTESEVPEECEKQISEEQELEQLINGQICFKTHTSEKDSKIILSGSFNPLHDGHLKLLEVANSICGDGFPCFEISAVNADKPPLSVSLIKDRVKQFEKVGTYLYFSYHRLDAGDPDFRQRYLSWGLV